MSQYVYTCCGCGWRGLAVGGARFRSGRPPATCGRCGASLFDRSSSRHPRISRQCQRAGCGVWFEGLRGRKYCDAHRIPAGRRNPRQKYHWTPERDAVLRDQYNSRIRGRSRAIARRLGWPAWVVKKRAAQLALTAPQPSALGHAWTPAEIAIVDEWVGRRSVKWIQEALRRRGFRRSQSAIIVRIKRMGLSRRIGEGYTMHDLEQALGIDHRRIARLVRERKLRGTPVRAGDPQLPGHAWHFTEEDVFVFLRDHRHEYRLDRLDQEWFLGLVFDQYLHQDVRRVKRDRAASSAA